MQPRLKSASRFLTACLRNRPCSLTLDASRAMDLKPSSRFATSTIRVHTMGQPMPASIRNEVSERFGSCIAKFGETREHPS